LCTNTISKKRKSVIDAEQERNEKIRIINESNARNRTQSDMLFSFNLIRFHDWNKNSLKKEKTKLRDNQTSECMQKKQLRLIHQNIELANHNQILKKQNDIDNETIRKLKNEIELLGERLKIMEQN
jgi:hypothetical protein